MDVSFSTPPAQYPLDPWGGTTYLPVTLSTDWEKVGYDPPYEGLAPSKNGPFPLVVFSPGFDLNAWQAIFIGTRLAVVQSRLRRGRGRPLCRLFLAMESLR
jgi:hypothetical protein